MGEEETNIRIYAVDKTASATRSAAKSIRRIGAALGERIDQILLFALGAVAVILSIAFAARSLAFGLGHITDMPVADQWAAVSDYFRIHDGQYKVFDLFSLHNEHRIFTTRLILFGDAYLFSMRGVFPIVVTYAALATIAALIIHIAVDKDRSALAPIVGVFAIIGMAWSTTQREVLEAPYAAGFPLVHLFPLLSHLALAKALDSNDSKRYAWLAGAVVGDFLAIYSLGSGFLTIVPAVAIAIWVQRIDTRIGILVVAHVIFTAAYFWHYSTHAPGFYGAASLAAYVDLASRILASALEPQYQRPIGYAMLVIIVSLSLYATRRAFAHKPISGDVAVLLGLACFVVLEASLVAYTRMRYGLAPRYSTPSIVCMMALMALAWRASFQTIARASIITAICLITIETNAPIFGQVWLLTVKQKAEARNAIFSGNIRHEDMQLTFLGLTPESAEQMLARLKELRLGPYR